jgi:hypothetical protein
LRLNNDAKMSRFLTVVENSSLSHELHQTTVLTSQNVQQNAQIELTLLVMFVFVSCFPLASIKCLERSQY